MQKVYSLIVLLSLTMMAHTQLPVTNLKVWYDADVNVNTNVSGNVTSWADNSGNGNNAVTTLTGATLETVTGHDGGSYSFVRFNGNSFLSSSYTGLGTGDMTVFIVFNNASNPSHAVDFHDGTDSLVYPFGNYRGSTGMQLSTDPQPTTKNLGNGVTGKDFEIVALRYERNHAISGISTWRNGMMLSARTSVDMALPSIPLYIGGYEDANQSTLATADIAQVIIYSTALDETDMAAAFTYLSGRYNLPQNQYLFTSIAPNEWNDPSSWAGNVVPSAADDVIIGPTGAFDWLYHTSGTAACKSLIVLENAGLYMNSFTSPKLVIGAGFGNNNELALKGSLWLDSSEIDINGNWLIASSRSDTLSEGLELGNSAKVVIDGNNGNALQSVSADKPLLDYQYPDIGFVNTARLGGITLGKADIIITDPHLAVDGIAVRNLTSSYIIQSPDAAYYGTLQFGDGVSTQGTNNPDGFVMSGECFIPLKVIAHDAVANTRKVTLQGGFVTLHAGVRVEPGGVFDCAASAILIGNDLDNDGTFISNQNSLNIAVSHEESDSLSIKGSGIFNLSNSSVRPSFTFTGSYDSTLKSRIGIYVPLTIDYGQFYAPNIRVFLHDQSMTIHYWNRSLTESSPDFIPYPSYFVFKGTGKLIHSIDYTPDSLRFYVGVDSTFIPLTIMDTFATESYAVSVKSGVTNGTNKPNLVDFEWQINKATPGGNDADLIFEWPKSKELLNPDSTTVQVRHFNSGITTWENLPTLTAQHSTFPFYRQVIAKHVSTFSPFSIGATALVLPVNLLTFTAHRVEQTTKLDWQTAQEENSDRFDIERSATNHPFTSIGTLAAAGNTSSLTNYSFTDLHPFDGVNYYRLKQIDIDGKFIYSKTIAVNFGDPGKVSISPNPATDYLDVRLPKGNRYTQIRIIDAAGKPVWQQAVNSSTVRVDISYLSKGWYVLQLSGDQPQQQVFLKQ